MNPTTANLARIDACVTTLAEEVDAAAHSAEMTRILQTMSRFWTYSARNCYLITLQRPLATRVASRTTWESLGRRIRRDQWRNAIQILCPHFRMERDQATGEERKVLSHFATGFVYDILQTEGADLPSVPWRQTSGYDDVYQALVGAAERFGLTVEVRAGLRDTLHGWSEGNGRIVLNVTDATGTRCAVLLHELGHELCHDRDARQTFTRQMLEAQAESIAYCCCMALDLPTPNTPNYLALYRIDRDMLLANLDAIRAGVVRVLRAVEHGKEVGSSVA